MLLKLLEVILACLGCWDIARRLLPFRVPVAVAELATIGLGLVLYRWADASILVPLCVPGGLMVLSVVVSPGPHAPWGSRALEAVRIYKQRHRQGMREARPTTRVGRRIPKL
jgi:hypothetical protein